MLSDINETVGRLARAHRDRAGLALADVAALVDGLSSGRLSELERGIQRWNIDLIAGVARALELEPRDLLPEKSAEALAVDADEHLVIDLLRRAGPAAAASTCVTIAERRARAEEATRVAALERELDVARVTMRVLSFSAPRRWTELRHARDAAIAAAETEAEKRGLVAFYDKVESLATAVGRHDQTVEEEEAALRPRRRS